MGHLYDFGLQDTGRIGEIIKNIITGNTALFVFISGFMFHHVFYKKFSYRKFVISKVKNVFLPYLFLSSLILFKLYINKSGYFDVNYYYYHFNTAFNVVDSDLITLLKYYVTGRMSLAYWYVPFAILLFSCSLFHFRYIKFNTKTQIYIIVAMSIVSIFMHRPVLDTNPIQSVIYFTPVYLIGIVTSIHSDTVKSYFYKKSRVIVLFVVVILLSMFQIYLGRHGNYHKIIFSYGGVDMMYLQKIAFCLLLYILFEQYTFKVNLVDYISKISFALFFIHPWVINVLMVLRDEFEVQTNSVITYIVSVCTVIYFSVLMSETVKVLFVSRKSSSRYLIGY